MTTYVLAGGCFWCLDAVFRRAKGVSEVMSGYVGGHIVNPTYEQVSAGGTGHAEAVKITFDELTIPGDVILDIFFLIHDPTTKNRQGNDVGTQYRSVMFYQTSEQKAAFEESNERASQHWNGPITTELLPLDVFYPAEPYHQDYFNNNPENGYCSIVIDPKIIKARQSFTQWFVKEDE